MNYTKFESFLDQPARHFYEKKLHFGVAKESADRYARPSEEDEQDSNVYYTYISSCEQTPRMPSFKSFSSITSPECSERAKNKLDAANANVRGSSVEAKTIFSFHRFEQVDIGSANPDLSFRESQDDADKKSQVLVTILSQTDLGDNLNSKIYSGMMKSMAIN